MTLTDTIHDADVDLFAAAVREAIAATAEVFGAVTPASADYADEYARQYEAALRLLGLGAEPEPVEDDEDTVDIEPETGNPVG